MITLIVDNFLTAEECEVIIKFYKDNKDKAKKFRDVYPLELSKDKYETDFLKNKLNNIAKNFNGEIDWFEIVKWPINSKQDLHIDDASKDTILSSITYLNDDFTGGQTHYEDGTTFKPKKGRSLFFNGTYYKHGVTPVSKNTRYVVASWYKKLNPSP
jgi:hypothetical protein|tara:strand:+ start:141 stop:611 length:471 start_codon:yes stop_codon:yes gene_type:complete